MPSKKQQQRAQGGGRKANSEPKQQVFKEFGGCNFQQSPRTFTLGKVVDQEQSDLQMNYVVVQNNIAVTANKTLETRNNIVKLLEPPVGRKFTKANILVGSVFYAGLDNGDLIYRSLLTGGPSGSVVLTDKTGESPNHHWQDFEYVDGKLVGTTSENQLWTGTLVSHELSNAKPVPQPRIPAITSLFPKGDLSISSELDDSHPFRIAIAWSYINKYGPTECSDQLTFYANHPVDEWHYGQYLRIGGNLARSDIGIGDDWADYDIKAIEIYYTTGNSASLLFAGRTDLITTEGKWAFDWMGYLDATSMWPVANLISPTENYTEGVKASHVACLDSRMYFWGNDESPQRLWIGGNSGNLFSISPGTGGGFVDVEPGTFQKIRVVTKYKTQSGASIITLLCDAINTSKEQRYNLVENQVSLSNEQSMKSWQAEQVAGAVGCKSYRGAVVCEDGLYAINRFGLTLTTMTMEYNAQIRTNYVSDPIKPAFTNHIANFLSDATILERDGIIYVAFGTGDDTLDNLLFCYDIDLKAWWTVSIGVNENILDLIHIDSPYHREGIGIVTENAVYMLPLSHDDSPEEEADFISIIQTGELSTQQPQQSWIYLSQLEFRFDYFIGTVLVTLTGIDQFGRKVTTKKQISHDETEYNLAEYMRVDLRLQSYQIRIEGTARYRMTHFIAKVYTMSAKQGLVWGFDDSQSFRSDGDIHPTFLDYNDIKKAIIP